MRSCKGSTVKVIEPSAIDGSATAPASKSMMVRAVATSILTEGTSELRNPSFSGDGMAALRIAEAMGATIVHRENTLFISGNGNFRTGSSPRTLDCRESGLCMRIFSSLAAIGAGRFLLTALGSLANRPMHMVEDLTRLGARCETKGGFAPVTIQGPIRGGHITVDCSITSQFLTGLLMALPLCRDDSIVDAACLLSTPYVAMTINLLNHYGISATCDNSYSRFLIAGSQKYVPCRYTVEGDWSGGAFLLVAGAIAGRVEVKGLDPLSLQADRRILEALVLAGAIVLQNDRSTTVTSNRLRAFDFDATDCPDLLPPLVALASCCDGTSLLYGAKRLIHKESNRASALLSEFRNMGISIDVKDNSLVITGGRIRGGLIDSHNDHRIAMACSVAALRGKESVMVHGAQCVCKSYPDFFSVLDGLKESHEQFR